MVDKKQPTPAQIEARRKFGEAAKARAAAKREEKEEATPTPQQPDNNDVDLLSQRIAELEKLLNLPQAAPQQAFTPVRSITKYSVNAKDYPDPRDRLFEESKLKLKGFNKDWFILEYRVDRVQYDKDSVHYVEPRFTLELWRWIEDPESGEPSKRRYRICTGMFFQDPDSFITVANERGIDVPDDIQDDFCNEMRYLAYRDWLTEAFYPPKSTAAKQRTEEVIGNVLVEVIEESSADARSASALLS